MDETVNLIGTFRSGTLKGTVWKVIAYADDGYVLNIGYEFHLSREGLDPMVSIDLLETPDLVSVLEQALTCTRDVSREACQLSLDKLFTVLRGAASSPTK